MRTSTQDLLSPPPRIDTLNRGPRQAPAVLCDPLVYGSHGSIYCGAAGLKVSGRSSLAQPAQASSTHVLPYGPNSLSPSQIAPEPPPAIVSSSAAYTLPNLLFLSSSSHSALPATAMKPGIVKRKIARPSIKATVCHRKSVGL